MKTDTILKYDRGVPRYTSYPTAHLFQDGLSEEDHIDWLEKLPADAPLSLYIHVPFCDSLCWFCGCHTKITQQHKPVSDYLKVLRQEIRLVGGHLDAHTDRRPVRHLHFGGGSPTILTGEEVTDLFEDLQRFFTFTEDAELALEIDPRDLPREHLQSWIRAGINRASLGVQDINPLVQRTINRIQTMEQTRDVVDTLRDGGVNAINMDLIYGLPHQTVESVTETVDAVLEMAPDRLALFGYAHMPKFKAHQRLIPEETLPDFFERFAQQDAAAKRLTDAGYIQIGLDHFAKPDDSLSLALKNGTLRRNFQGYTSDRAEHLIGLGASSISALPQAIIQNKVPINLYKSDISEGRLPMGKFIPLSAEDRLRGEVIEKLMCFQSADLKEICARHGVPANHFDQECQELHPMIADSIVSVKDGVVEMQPGGRALVRAVCAVFDAYHDTVKRSYSKAV